MKERSFREQADFLRGLLPARVLLIEEGSELYRCAQMLIAGRMKTDCVLGSRCDAKMPNLGKEALKRREFGHFERNTAQIGNGRRCMGQGEPPSGDGKESSDLTPWFGGRVHAGAAAKTHSRSHPRPMTSGTT